MQIFSLIDVEVLRGVRGPLLADYTVAKRHCKPIKATKQVKLHVTSDQLGRRGLGSFAMRELMALVPFDRLLQDVLVSRKAYEDLERSWNSYQIILLFCVSLRSV